MRVIIVDYERGGNTHLRNESCVQIECCAVNFALTSSYIGCIYCLLDLMYHLYLYNTKMAPIYILQYTSCILLLILHILFMPLSKLVFPVEAIFMIFETHFTIVSKR